MRVFVQKQSGNKTISLTKEKLINKKRTMELKITIDPVSYSEFMGLELEYVLENWEEILKKILQACEELF
jgi:hypothetical protein